GAPFGVGSDTGGSVRIPAGFCGIVSHKPTGGTVPATGHYPHAPRGIETMMQLGPMARSVADLELLLAVLSGPDGVDETCVRQFRPERIELSEVRVVAMPTNGVFRPTREVAAAVHTAAATLRERGARIVDYDGPSLTRGFEWWAALLATSGERYEDLVGGGRRPRLRRELSAWPFGRSRHSGGVLAMLTLERLAGVVPEKRALVEEARATRDALDGALGDHTVLLHPVYARTAPRHRAIALRDPRDVAATALFNVTESPVTVVPVATGRGGLPIGVQVVGARGRDALTLAVARALEESHGTPDAIDPRRRP
ncbi:MAG: amidase, partial [Myxococcales bacterium]|nr:amidase [Myxococcales bacterium]